MARQWFVLCRGIAFENNHGSEKVPTGFLMMFGGVVFGPAVSLVGLSRPPVDTKLTNCDLYPHLVGDGTNATALPDCLSPSPADPGSSDFANFPIDTPAEDLGLSALVAEYLGNLLLS